MSVEIVRESLRSVNSLVQGDIVIIRDEPFMFIVEPDEDCVDLFSLVSLEDGNKYRGELIDVDSMYENDVIEYINNVYEDEDLRILPKDIKFVRKSDYQLKLYI